MWHGPRQGKLHSHMYMNTQFEALKQVHIEFFQDAKLSNVLMDIFSMNSHKLFVKHVLKSWFNAYQKLGKFSMICF
jgi:hypothetical protein